MLLLKGFEALSRNFSGSENYDYLYLSHFPAPQSRHGTRRDSGRWADYPAAPGEADSTHSCSAKPEQLPKAAESQEIPLGHPSPCPSHWDVAGIAAPGLMSSGSGVGKGALDITAVAGREFCHPMVYGVISPRFSAFFRLWGNKKGTAHMVGWRT